MRPADPKRNGATTPIFKTYPPRPTVEQLQMQNEGLRRALHALSDALAQLELKVLYTMSTMQFQVKQPGAIMDVKGNVPTHIVSLLQRFENEKDAFVAAMMGPEGGDDETAPDDARRDDGREGGSGGADADDSGDIDTIDQATTPVAENDAVHEDTGDRISDADFARAVELGDDINGDDLRTRKPQP